MLKQSLTLRIPTHLRNYQTAIFNVAPATPAGEMIPAAGRGKVAAEGKRGFVTFLAGNGDYVKGAVGLAKGLRKVKSAYGELVVAVLPDVPEEHRKILRSQGCVVREIEPVQPPVNQFDDYSKMIYLDADIQVYDNIDHLFDMAEGYFYAVKDCFCEKTWSHSLQYSIGYCQQCPEKVKWPPEMGSPPPLYFNAGMFLFEPSRLTCQALLDCLEITAPTPFAEQDFLNMFFGKIYKPIPLIYNLVLAMLWRHPENVELDKVKVVHYCAAGSKPWRYTGKEQNMEREDIKMLVAKWWDIYNDESLDFKEKQLASQEGSVEGFPIIRDSSLLALLMEQRIIHVTAPSVA